MQVAQLAIGKKVRTRSDFSGVPEGTEGTVVEASNSWPDTDSVAVKWNRYEGDKLTDWFDLSELEYLEAL